MQTQMLIMILAVIAGLAAVALWFYLRKRQTLKLRARFGTEYDQAVARSGSEASAEEDLKARVKRVKQFNITPLPPDEGARFSQAWYSLQSKFVDNPKMAVEEADRLVIDLMKRRGYPTNDFEQRAADLSVDHPIVVVNYRAAHEIALRNQSGEASTEDLRTALVYFRALFGELLEVRQFDPVEVHH
jgi:hypothetical protein